MQAFGTPGVEPTWTSSAKDMVVTALGHGRVWATLGHGILNEVYWPVTGQPQIRDLGFIVGGENWWAELKRVNTYQLSLPEPHVPLPKIVHRGDRYQLTLEFLPDPGATCCSSPSIWRGLACGCILCLPRISESAATITPGGLTAVCWQAQRVTLCVC